MHNRRREFWRKVWILTAGGDPNHAPGIHKSTASLPRNVKREVNIV